MKFVLEPIDTLPRRTKRIIYGGVRKKAPFLLDDLYYNSEHSFYTFILEAPYCFPCVISWQDLQGVDHYIEVIKLKIEKDIENNAKG